MTPEGWNIRPLGALFEVQLGKMLSPKSRIGNDPLPYLRNVNVQWGRVVLDDVVKMDFSEQEKEKFRLRFGDLLVCEGGEVGRAAIWKDQMEECYYQKALHRLRPLVDAILPEYMFHYLMLKFQIQQAFSGERSETTIAHLPRVRLLKLPVSLPPLPEQKKIAAILGSVDEAIQATQAVIDQTRKVKQGLLAQLLTRGIGHTRFKKTEIGEIPEAWEVVRLGDMGEFTNGINKGKEDFGFGVPFVNLQDVFGVNQIIVPPQGLVNATPEEIDRYDLREGDALFVRSSVKPEGVGLTAVIGERLRNVVFSGFLIRFRQHEPHLSKHFMKYCFYEPGFRRRLLIKSSVSANTNVNQKSLGQLMVAVPPAKEQEAMCSMFNSLESAIKMNETKLRQIACAKRGLTQDLLTGRVRVKGVA